MIYNIIRLLVINRSLTDKLANKLSQLLLLNNYMDDLGILKATLIHFFMRFGTHRVCFRSDKKGSITISVFRGTDLDLVYNKKYWWEGSLCPLFELF